MLAAVVAMAVVSSTPLAAQQFFGSILGTVTDTSGAIIPGATVTVLNKATGEKHTTTSNTAGDYQVVSLVPAVYSVIVERANFKRHVSDSVRVDVNATVRINAALAVGAVTETVEVNLAGTVELQTDSGTISNKVETQQTAELPLNGRNIMQLLNITPGVIPTSGIEQGATLAQNAGTSSNPLSWGGGSSVYTINGGDNEEYIDGAPINMLQGSNIGIMMTADAIQEFNVDTSASSAEEGRASGGSLSFTTKTGTNSFHGTAYEYFNNADLNANNFFNNQAGIGRPKNNQNLWGFNLGLPIKRDRIFFFGSFEKDYILKSSPSLINMPSNGNAASANFTGGSSDIWDGRFARQIIDPNAATDGCVSTTGSGPASGPYNGKGILYDAVQGIYFLGTQCWDSTATIMRTFWANTPAVNSASGNYAANFPAGDIAPEMNVRMDFIVSPKQRIFAHVAWWAPLDKPLIPFPNPNVPSALPNAAPWNLGMEVGGFNSNDYIVGDTYTFSPKTVLDLRAEWIRFRFSMIPKINNFATAGLGGQWGSFQQYLPNGNSYLPSPTLGAGGQVHNLAPLGIGFTNSSGGTWSTGGQGQQWNNYGLNGGITHVFGKHSVKFGFEARLMDMELLHNSFATGNPNFGVKFSCVYSGNSCQAGTGDEWAEFMMGDFQSVSFNGSYGGAEFNWYQSYFAQDTWQATRKLTLNLGVRYELPGGLYERKNHTDVFLPTTSDPASGAYGTDQLVASKLSPSRSTTPVKMTDINPRIGFAYRLNDKTVVRGGFGISQVAVDADNGGNGAAGAPTNSQTLGWSNPTIVANNAINPVAATLSNPIPASAVYVKPQFNSNPNFLQTLAQANQTSGGVGVAGNVLAENLPYFEEYNFAVQRQIGSSFSITASYVGSHGLRLKAGQGVDEIPASAYTITNAGVFNAKTTNGVTTYSSAEGANAATGAYTGSAITGLVPTGGTLAVPNGQGGLVNPALTTFTSGVYCTPGYTAPGAGVTSFNGYCNSNWKVGNSLQPYPNYKSASISNLYKGNQHYNSLQVSTQWRIPGGGLIGAALTWAKTIDDTKGQQDFYNPHADKGPDGVPARLAINANYPLPIGHGQKYFNVSNGAVSTIISGWAINDVTAFQHGGYLAIGTSNSSSLASFGSGTVRSSYVPTLPGCNSQKVIKGSAVSRLNNWFNTNCFTGVNAYGKNLNNVSSGMMGVFDWGNETPNDRNLFAQGLDNSDISLAKTTKVAEKLSVIFRMETFNTFNRFQASAPANLNAGNTNFGVVTTQANNPRQVQLSLRVTY
jgi:hypothetical protein